MLLATVRTPNAPAGILIGMGMLALAILNWRYAIFLRYNGFIRDTMGMRRRSFEDRPFWRFYYKEFTSILIGLFGLAFLAGGLSVIFGK